MEDNSPTETLAAFVSRIRFQDLQNNVVRETKRTLLDSLGCTLASATKDKGKICVELAKRLGGPPEATVLGSGQRVSCAAAAFANGEMMMDLDYDPLLPPAHNVPFAIPSCLAMAEREGVSGEDIIIALSVGNEIACRIGVSLVLQRRQDARPRNCGYSYAAFGATSAACKILKLDQEAVANAFGIVCQMIPIPTGAKWKTLLHIPMYKYTLAGAVAEAGVKAALLAELGYAGDTSVLDGDYGFWRMYGADDCRWKEMTGGLGKDWLLTRASYKPYPCCGRLHSMLDAFINIIQEHGLRADEIESVTVMGDPSNLRPMRMNKKINTYHDAQFSVPYSLAVAAHHVKIGPDWQSSDTMSNSSILEFMDKVRFEPHPRYKNLVESELLFRTTSPGYAKVVARGRVFEKEVLNRRGSPVEGFIFSDEELKDKYRRNVSLIIQGDKLERSINLIYNLEKLGNIGDLTSLLKR